MNKPTLTREQSDALKIANEIHGKGGVLEWHISEPTGWSREGSFAPLNDIDPLTMAAALVNGWETEKSPIDILREDFQEKRSGCSEVIIALGATGQVIEGINA